jgi:hypothetical protein
LSKVGRIGGAEKNVKIEKKQNLKFVKFFVASAALFQGSGRHFKFIKKRYFKVQRLATQRRGYSMAATKKSKLRVAVQGNS